MPKANQGLTKNYWLGQKYWINLTPTLTFDTQFLEDESLTSWVIRASFSQFCSPSSFAYYYWSDLDFRFWQQDVDKGFELSAPRIHQDIATLAGCDESDVRKHTLVHFAEIINGDLHSSVALPWTSPLSKRSRYSRIGYPYCPDCMADDKQACLALVWRLSWTVCCTKHKRFLQNQCPHCLYPYQPQLIPLEVGKINHCHHCHEKINSPMADNQETPSDLILEYQNTANQVYKTGTGMVFGKEVVAEEWFATLLFLINMTKRAFDNVEYMFGKVLISMGVLKENHEFIKPKPRLIFDHLSVKERASLFFYAYQLIKKSKPLWIKALLDNNATQNSFDWSKSSYIPSPFQTIYDELTRTPKTKRKSKSNSLKPTSPKVVIGQWQRMQRKIEMEQHYDSHKKENSKPV